VDRDRKLLPNTVKVNPFTPAATVLGLRAVMAGAGLEMAAKADFELGQICPTISCSP
jgi:hypothetical protein